MRGTLIDPTITEYGGRMVKLMGDGALVEFASVVDAVECAVMIQRGVVERNTAIPDNRSMYLIPASFGHGAMFASRGKADMTPTTSYLRVCPKRTLAVAEKFSCPWQRGVFSDGSNR